MLSIVSAISGSSKHALVLISLIVVVTIVDSQFVNAFYGTSSLGSPGNLHLLLFVSFAIIASIINTILLLFAKRNDIQERSTRSFSTYMITLTRQEKAIIIGEAEKLFYKLVKGSMNKVITDRTFNKSSLSSSLPLLSPSDEQQSRVKSSPTAANHRMTI